MRLMDKEVIEMELNGHLHVKEKDVESYEKCVRRMEEEEEDEF